ncbi:unnamed protein product [Mycena citricolor]|uniref:Uncharacterized protein n=1 Tax=Mycena citricolor TaxID=2018698 RepID=A0AAD2HHY2_9AGAR|nr:unnamed protein product [Mycena citricolor]
MIALASFARLWIGSLCQDRRANDPASFWIDISPLTAEASFGNTWSDRMLILVQIALPCVQFVYRSAGLYYLQTPSIRGMSVAPQPSQNERTAMSGPDNLPISRPRP